MAMASGAAFHADAGHRAETAKLKFGGFTPEAGIIKRQDPSLASAKAFNAYDLAAGNALNSYDLASGKAFNLM